MAESGAMDLNATAPPEPVLCSICQDPVVLPPSQGARAVALLKCNHSFHLDCIGSAFNARGTMQCPNCRDTEEGDWLSANSFQPSTDSSSDFGNRVRWGRYPVFNFLTQSPIGGPIPISSGIEGGPTADLSNVQVSDGTEPRNEIEHPHFAALQMVHLAHRHTNPFGVDVQGYIGSSPQRSTQPAPRSRGTYVASGHGLRGRVIQQTASPATRSTPYPSTSRRVRPWVLSMASSSIAAEDVEPHHPGDVAANAQNSDIPNQVKASRRPQP
ncbi:unnamed protein product [Urochloa decumbens]|uniref:RING-type domain-containing protein n=1 Tax=Urochloa decumbens TaxID=240449 RepID=A0ABC9FUD1_9POAL